MLLQTTKIYHNEKDPHQVSANEWIGVVHGTLFFDTEVDQILIALVPTWSFHNVYHTLAAVRDGDISDCPGGEEYPITVNERTGHATINGFTFTFDELDNSPSIVVDTEPRFEAYVTVISMMTNIQLAFKLPVLEKHFKYHKMDWDRNVDPMRVNVEETPTPELKSIDTDLKLKSWITERSIIVEIGDDAYQFPGWVHEDIKTVTQTINWKLRSNLQIEALCPRPRGRRPLKRLTFKHEINTYDGIVTTR